MEKHLHARCTLHDPILPCPWVQIRACVSRYDQSAWIANDEAQNDAHIAS